MYVVVDSLDYFYLYFCYSCSFLCTTYFIYVGAAAWYLRAHAATLMPSQGMVTVSYHTIRWWLTSYHHHLAVNIRTIIHLHTIHSVFISHESVTPPMLRSILCLSWHLHLSWQVNYLFPTNCVQFYVQSIWIQQQCTRIFGFHSHLPYEAPSSEFILLDFGNFKTQYRHYYTVRK